MDGIIMALMAMGFGLCALWAHDADKIARQQTELISKLIERLIEVERKLVIGVVASDLWDHDADRDEGSYDRRVKEYREDVERGSRP